MSHLVPRCPRAQKSHSSHPPLQQLDPPESLGSPPFVLESARIIAGCRFSIVSMAMVIFRRTASHTQTRLNGGFRRGAAAAAIGTLLALAPAGTAAQAVEGAAATASVSPPVSGPLAIGSEHRSEDDRSGPAPRPVPSGPSVSPTPTQPAPEPTSPEDSPAQPPSGQPSGQPSGPEGGRPQPPAPAPSVPGTPAPPSGRGDGASQTPGDAASARRQSGGAAAVMPPDRTGPADTAALSVPTPGAVPAGEGASPSPSDAAGPATPAGSATASPTSSAAPAAGARGQAGSASRDATWPADRAGSAALVGWGIALVALSAAAGIVAFRMRRI